MKKGEKRKLELVQIAYRMFLTKGYENTSVDEILEEAGIAKGTFYYYFESKELLLEEVIISNEGDKVTVMVVPTNEELAIARQTASLVK